MRNSDPAGFRLAFLHCSKTTPSFEHRPLDIVGRKGGYGTDVKVPANTWHSLRIDFKASRFSVSFNGKQLFEVEDSTFTDAGQIGLWTKADGVTLFDEVTYGETK